MVHTHEVGGHPPARPVRPIASVPPVEPDLPLPGAEAHVLDGDHSRFDFQRRNVISFKVASGRIARPSGRVMRLTLGGQHR